MIKHWINASMVVLTAIQLNSCSTPNGKTGLEDDNDTETAVSVAKTPENEVAKELAAVSIWDKVSVRETPDQKGKWLTSLSIGETLVFLNERKSDATDDNKEYMKVRLNDGKEGWTRSDFVIPEAQAAVFIEETYVYKRPDLLTKSGDAFSQMDIVAVIETQDDWLKVKGKRSEGKWIDEGWIKASNLSLEAVDIATAKFSKAALANEDEAKRQTAILDIVGNNDLSSSVFIADLQKMIAAPVVEEAQDTEEYITEYQDETDGL